MALRPLRPGPKTGRVCGAERDRTDDLRLAKPALSQLSYSPEKSTELTPVPCSASVRLSLELRGSRPREHSAVGRGRLELPTSRLSGVRSNHLSYWPARESRMRARVWRTERKARVCGGPIAQGGKRTGSLLGPSKLSPITRFDCSDRGHRALRKRTGF